MMRSDVKLANCAASGCKFTETLMRRETGKPVGIVQLLRV
jgi:hypothetical protein